MDLWLFIIQHRKIVVHSCLESYLFQNVEMKISWYLTQVVQCFAMDDWKHLADYLKEINSFTGR